MSRAYMTKAQRDDWETPQRLYDALNGLYQFTLDPAASHENHKAPHYFTREMNGLAQSWEGERVFCNPPYGRALADWVSKAATEATHCPIIVLLIPARTDTRWFHQHIYHHAHLTFLKGRLRFELGGGTPTSRTIPLHARHIHPHDTPTTTTSTHKPLTSASIFLGFAYPKTRAANHPRVAGSSARW